jgi:hypothetical protein
MSDEWMMRIEEGLAAHFKMDGGGSRPGVDWVIGIKRGEDTYKVPVRVLFAENASPETQADQEYQARSAIQYLRDQLDLGWHPDQKTDHVIVLSDSL